LKLGVILGPNLNVKKMKIFSRGRRVCFTAYTDEEPTFGGNCTYLVYQRESGDEKHREHWQGYAEFKSAKSLKAVQKTCGIPNAHLENAGGTATEAAEYCMKDDTRMPDTDFKEHGERMPDQEQGKRNDILELRDVAMKASSKTELLVNDDAMPSLAKYGRFADMCMMAGLKKRTREFREVEVIIHYGKSGAGKTRKAYETGAHIIDLEKNEWWDGYDGEDTILIDEFDGSQCTLTRMLRLLDGYQCRLPIKGGFTYAQWTKVYITSNLHPDKWLWNGSIEQMRGFERRVTQKVHFDSL